MIGVLIIFLVCVLMIGIVLMNYDALVCSVWLDYSDDDFYKSLSWFQSIEVVVLVVTLTIAFIASYSLLKVLLC